MQTTEIHVWTIALGSTEAHYREAQGVLTRDETCRARRFVIAEHRIRWATSRASLRRIIAGYVKATPQAIRFRVAEFGKPELSHPRTQPQLHFSLSHSGEMAVLAVTRSGPVGIDVEQIRNIKGMGDLARRFFSLPEQRAFVAVREARRVQAFYNCWTRKEAYLKALGTGLSKPLGSFDVVLEPELPPAILAIDGQTRKARDWRLFEFQPAPDYVGALAIRSPNLCEVVYREYTTDAAAAP